MRRSSNLNVDSNYTFVLQLDYGGNYEQKLFQLENGWNIRFELGPSLFGKVVQLYTTHPLDSAPSSQTVGDETWYEVKLTSGSASKNDNFCVFGEIVCCKSGPHRFVYVCDQYTLDKPNGCGFFQVLPFLKRSKDDFTYRMQSFYCQTMLTKLLGPVPEWEDRLRVASDSGYNMIHLTPIQTLGISNSSYSIADQLELNPAFIPAGNTYTFDHIQALVEKMLVDHRTYVLSDVVWNHTAKNSHWLQEHPECTYNLVNSPHLRPAYLLDRVLAYFGQDVADGKYVDKGLPTGKWEEHNLDKLRNILQNEIYPPVHLEQLFQVDVNRLVNEFSARLGPVSQDHTEDKALKINIIQDQQYRRFGSTIDMDTAVRMFNKSIFGCADEQSRKKQCVDCFRQALEYLNDEAAKTCSDHLRSGVDALLGHVSYQRVQKDGPAITYYDEHNTLFPTYFYVTKAGGNWQRDEKAMHDPETAKFVMAHNGWVMKDDPLSNFAEYPSQVYLKRELVAWADSVKLRYGKQPADCPYLWQRMTEYSRISAKIFYGFRLDNCHSTPIHVAEYLLKQARMVRPELFVVAELFTQNEGLDNYFVNRLGINALIREALVAPDAHEQGRLIYRYGGKPVGSFYATPYRRLESSIALAMLFDQTHDNPSLISSRTVYDLLPTAAMVSSADCAVGSNRGYDEIVPYHIHVVHEERLYTSWTSKDSKTFDVVNLKSGIIQARREMSALHHYMNLSNFDEVFVDQKSEDVTVIRRYCPSLMESIVWVIRNCFNDEAVNRSVQLAPLNLAGTLRRVLFECHLTPRGDYQPSSDREELAKKYIVGLDKYILHIKDSIMPAESEYITADTDPKSEVTELEMKDIPPGFVMAMSVSITDESKASLKLLHLELSRVNTYIQHSLRFYTMESKAFRCDDLAAIVKRMTLADINYALFRNESEERSCHPEFGSYEVPRFGRFVYCGIQGIHYHMNRIRSDNDLGHPLCDNLRQGDWLADYLTNRLLVNKRTEQLGQWFDTIFKIYKNIPHFIKPCYFELIVSSVYNFLCDEILNKMSKFVRDGSLFLRSLAISSTIFCGCVPPAPLPILSENVKFLTREMHMHYITDRNATTITAGLPHFGGGLFRNWGRDTFIALRGLMMVTGRFDEARCIILGYAGAMRHGLIPNLLGEGTHARYNCRDAVWWWLLSIKYFVDMAPNGADILKDPVNRVYANDDAEPYSTKFEQPLCDTMQEALNAHFQCQTFRERNAGHAIDEHMKDQGFCVEYGVDIETGFVYGGNQWNCGTWMDKMGSSDKAGNRGIPATPRDGSAVELVAISYAVVSWLDVMQGKGIYPHSKVTRSTGCKELQWTWATWKSAISHNFEACFWVAKETEALSSTCDRELVNVRGIYKDTYKATQAWADYQLRPNFVVAMAIAPDLFDLKHALLGLKTAEEELLGPLGMKTLTAKDWNYRPFYDNSNNSELSNVARGFNYHQGPEWLWPLGFFLRAKLITAKKAESSQPGIWTQAVNDVHGTLANSWTHLSHSPWFSLPELTNKNGAHCRDSCEAQAWTIGSLLELFYDLDQYDN